MGKPKQENEEELRRRVELLDEKLKTIEPTIIRQEHSSVAILSNLYKYFVQETGENEELKNKRLATVYSALGWMIRITKRRMIILGGGGLIAILTLLIGYFTLREFQKQNAEFAKQNEAIVEQNNYLQEQNIQTLRAVNSAAVSALIADIESERMESVADGLHPDKFWYPSKSLTFRIYSVAKALAPYESVRFTSFGVDTTYLLSPERGILLRALVSANVDFPLSPNPTFQFADLRDISLNNVDLDAVDLRNADLSYSSLENVRFSVAKLSGANFSHAYFSNTLLGDSDLRNAIFINSHLIGADFSGVNLKSTNFSRALIDTYYVEVDVIDHLINRRPNHYIGSKMSFQKYALKSGAFVWVNNSRLPDSLQNPDLYR